MAGQSEQIWRERVASWKKSGQTATEYARQIGVRPQTLAWWGWRIRTQPAKPGKEPAKPQAAGFVEIRVSTSETEEEREAPAEPLELMLGEGLRLRIPVRFDEGSLRRVVATLGGK